MSFGFSWNVYADQPHNVALKKERLRHHLRYAGSYVALLAPNFRRAIPILSLYRKYRKRMYEEPVRIENPFGISISPAGERSEEVLELLKEAGVSRTLVRVPSWEKEKLGHFERFFELISERNFELVIALLQQRDDVLNPSGWARFVEDVFSRFRKFSPYFEIGHAWNRTKWGVWDYREYLKLAREAFPLAQEYQIKLVGPAVIDFEFHLYPPVMDAVPFDKVSSLLYVDRLGAPENKQFGWDTSKKVALLKAVVDGVSRRERELWITEVNWPLKGTGKYSPAAGKPMISEEEQADYLVRYYILCLASGLVERVYWWQLVAPGYGLIDSREKEWRKRPGFYAMKTMARFLENSIFTGKVPHPQAMIFSFKKEAAGKEENFAVCWTAGAPCGHVFSPRIGRVLSRDGKELYFRGNEITIDSSPKYIFFEKMGAVPVYFKKDEVEEYERKRYRGADQRLVDKKEKKILHKILCRVVDRAGRDSIHALDIPCGYGRFSELLLDKGFNLTSSDLSFEMVKRAKERSPVPAHLLAVAADAKKGLPFKNAKFDLVLSMRFFHHVHLNQERCAILKEFSRVSAEWAILSFYKTNWLHSLQRKLRRVIKKSKTQIKMIPDKTFRQEARSADLRIVKVYPLLKGIHAQHIALLRKI